MQRYFPVHEYLAQSLIFCLHSILATLYLQGNAFVGSIPDGLSRLTTLLDLRLSDNRLIGEISEDLIELYRLGKYSCYDKLNCRLRVAASNTCWFCRKAAFE